MLEDIVLLERTRNKKPEEYVFKFEAHEDGEYDMVVYNTQNDTYELYEIKHSKSEDFEKQSRHLKNEKLFNLMTKGFGEIDKKVILYRDNYSSKADIRYINVEGYLDEIGYRS